MVDATLEAMARGGLYDQLGGGFARYSVDGRLGGAALREDALRQRPAGRALRPVGDAAGGAGRPRDRRLPAPRAAHRRRAASPPRWTPTPRVSRAGSTPGRPTSSTEVAGPRRRRLGRRAARRSPRPARSSTARPRCSCAQDPDDAERLATSGAGCSPPANTGSARPATTRWSPPGTGWPSADCATPGLLLDEPSYVDAAVAAGRLLVDVHLADGRLLRVSRDGVAGRHAGVLEDHGCRRGRLPGADPGDRRRGLAGARGRRCWTRALAALPGRRRRLPRHRRRRGGAGRPAPRPLRQRQPVGAVADGARPGDVRRADRVRPAPAGRRGGAGLGGRAGPAGAPLRRAGAWPPPQAMLDGPRRDRRGRAGRTGPGRAGRRGPPAPGRGGRRRRRTARGHPAAGGPHPGRRPPRGVRLPAPGLRPADHRAQRPLRSEPMTESERFDAYLAALRADQRAALERAARPDRRCRARRRARHQLRGAGVPTRRPTARRASPPRQRTCPTCRSARR